MKSKLDKWINELRLNEYAKKTLTDYRHGVELFINWVKEDSFTINKDFMLDFKDYLAEKFSLNSRNKYIVEINKFLKYCGYNDCTLKKFETQTASSIDDPIYPQEHKRLLRWAKKLEMEDMYLIMRIFAEVGPRVIELKYFTVENLESSYIHGAYNKGKERTLIVPNELRRELKAYCKREKITTGIIFRSPVNFKDSSKMLNVSTIWRRLKKIARAAKINPDKIHPHAWRHLFAKQCKANGIDLDELSDILGHNDIRTTALYTRTSNREKKEKLERLWKKGRKDEGI